MIQRRVPLDPAFKAWGIPTKNARRPHEIRGECIHCRRNTSGLKAGAIVVSSDLQRDPNALAAVSELSERANQVGEGAG